MALDSAAVKELLHKLDADREAYLTTLTRAHETLARALSSSAVVPGQSTPSAPASGAAPSPILSPTSTAHPFPFRRRAASSHLELESFKKSSFISGDTSSESDDDESFFAQQPLPSESFTQDELRAHLEGHDWEEHGRRVLGSVLTEKQFLRPDGVVFEHDKSAEKDVHATVYEVGGDGSALLYRSTVQNVSESIWQSLSNTNCDPQKLRQAVGRIIIVREPSPLVFGAIHCTLNGHFDMDEIYRMLSDDSHTKAYFKGCFEGETRMQRSFLFCLKYHTIIGDDRTPMTWQKSDNDRSFSRYHIPITSCSSVVALSFSGEPTTTLKSRSRRKKQTVGRVFDPFSPWRVMSIQCFPDWKSSVDVHETNRHYVNGPEAFLVTLLAEYRDAQKRLLEINKKIVALATPPPDFMFDRELRDNLLFEDQNYTYSRRYFWTYQTLAIMSDNIQAMITAYRETFTDDVWNGKHKFIWPGSEDTSSRYSNWRKKMRSLRKEFEEEIRKLEHLLELNVQEQKEIKSLRDQLFSGTSVQESRKSVEQTAITVQQGHNIKLLTLVSIFFLPLTFVTSVFGMTNMPPDDNFVPFGIVIVIICLPTYLLIGSLNTTQGMKFWRERTMDLFRLIGKIVMYIFNFFRPESEKSKRLREKFAEDEDEKKKNEDGERPVPRSRTTLQNMETRKASQANILGHQEITQSPTAYHHRNRSNTIKFDESTLKKSSLPRRSATLQSNRTGNVEEDSVDPAHVHLESSPRPSTHSTRTDSGEMGGVLGRLSTVFDRGLGKESLV